MKHEQCEDSLGTARAVFNNMGVALPQGDLAQVKETLETNDYMGWQPCTMQEAQAAADNGVAAIGISDERIVVLSANDEEQPVAATASVMSIPETTTKIATAGMDYYVYNNMTTNQGSCEEDGGCYHFNNRFNHNNKDILLNDLITILGNRQDLISKYTTAECVDIILNHDGTITDYCNLYSVPKELVQTLLLRELWCVDTSDSVADSAVEAYFGWKKEYEYWANLPAWQQIIIAPPTPPTVMREDSSTGIGQMFASVAINAHNLAITRGLINGDYYNVNDWHDCKHVWYKLHNDDGFAIKMTTLEMYHCADYAGVYGSLFHCTQTQIKAILARYNGTGSDATDYGNECYEYYKIFKKYS